MLLLLLYLGRESLLASAEAAVMIVFRLEFELDTATTQITYGALTGMFSQIPGQARTFIVAALLDVLLHAS